MEAKKILKSIYVDLPYDKNVDLKDDILIWIDNFGAENSVSIKDIAYEENKIAWWQCNSAGLDLVFLKLNPKILITWEIPLNTMGQSSLGCSNIFFYKNYLIVKYHDKHSDRIFFFNTNNLKIEEILTTSCHWKKIKLMDNRLYIWNIRGEECLEVTIFENNLERTITSLIDLNKKGIVLEN
ncbi:hypothetical protein ATE47_07465 [Chryseobacterium sp. IHB B 17019]|uniref:hypothetical protein n=1 Tax=Chryseobacterium sp. IHB B 17019 TaxID=1721091 RepID=UPI0007222045|nr:hypothetical protein [Chryseobacterium sp. IHB B 17019]ALR30369.1 hypothetical protein ATE47_07465 [Chryseobacterium sp. IHB B 17019]